MNANMDSKWIRKGFVSNYRMSVRMVSVSVLRTASVLTKIKDSGTIQVRKCIVTHHLNSAEDHSSFFE